ncbi:FAD-dependent oxidoreductase [Albidovulum sp.]|uniref:oxidoreductase n=1 Tax=Albidovulum sp. TaxID=1872424 RepID=UPI0039B98F04
MVRSCLIRNRILSTGHQTYLAEGNFPGERMIAYHAARAKGGAGLIITEAARFHTSSRSDAPDLTIMGDEAIPAYARLAAAVHRHGSKIFGQLSHAGSVTRQMSGGMRGEVFAPSPVPDHRFQVLPREMPTAMMEELIDAAGDGARRYTEAGYDGVELMASHGLLFAQFLNPYKNHRTDKYGGSEENRLRPLREALTKVREAVGESLLVGLRISADEDDPSGLDKATVHDVCRRLSSDGLVDYLNITYGSMAGLGSSVHVAPPMEMGIAYLAREVEAIRRIATVPLFHAGRINQPREAEKMLRDGIADMCGMTRAMISDPDMPRKALSGLTDNIRACIGCNQACIGHYHIGLPISCIQNPLAGRERLLSGELPRSGHPLTILIAGAGPAGMKAALTVKAAGDIPLILEAASQAGGQALLAQLLPSRAEFGGLVTNLAYELREAGIATEFNRKVDIDLIRKISPDAVIIATGSQPFVPLVEGREAGDVIEATSYLAGKAEPGASVVIADWRCDWQGVGVAVLLASRGHRVRLAVNGTAPATNLQQYVRDFWAGQLHRSGIEVIPYARLFGVDADNAYFIHEASHEPIILEDVDTVITVCGRVPDQSLDQEIAADGIPFISIGDSKVARSAEEAIFEGYVEVQNFLRKLHSADGMEVGSEGGARRVRLQG